jgi:3-methyladenine DNA glycosylase/8-oxoguanine DNA glycosylase
MIHIAHPACKGIAHFAHLDAALAFLRMLAGQITPDDFTAVIVATSGPAYEALAHALIAACLGTPL